MKADEYLEEVVKDSFGRELEVNENIARTLPFFAASLAVAVPIYGYIAGRLPPLAPSLMSVVLHGLLASGAGCGVMILWNLFLMVQLREYRIPPRESAQIEWMQALKAYFEDEGLTAATVDRKVTQQLRDRMIIEYAASAEHNREANAPKLRARASGVVYFSAMLTIAFAMIAIIFVSQRLPKPPPQDAAHVASQAESQRAAEAGRRAAAAAEAAGPAVGPEVSGGAGSQHRAGGGSQVTEADKAATTPPATPTAPAAPAAQPPAPPPHQLLKKNEDGGGPLVERR